MTQDKIQEALDSLDALIEAFMHGAYNRENVHKLVKEVRQALQSQLTNSNEMVSIPTDLFRLLIQHWNNEEVSKDDGYYIRTMIEAYNKPKPHICTAWGYECLPPVNEATGHDTE